MSTENKSYKDCTLTDELLERRNRFTPDFLDRKMEKQIPIFVYDRMRAGSSNFSFVKDAIPLGEAYTTAANFVMETAEDDQAVVFQLEQPNSAGHRVYGEVYLVSPKDLLNIDYLVQNNIRFERSLRYVFLQEQSIPAKNKTMRPSVKCWIYTGKKTFWDQYETTPKRSVEINNQRVYNWEPAYASTKRENLLAPLVPGLMEKYETEMNQNGKLPF